MVFYRRSRKCFGSAGALNLRCDLAETVCCGSRLPRFGLRAKITTCIIDCVQSYGDTRLLHEATGHLCLEYEVPEMVTLIYLSVLFRWDVHLLPTIGYGQGFICHDEWIHLGFDDPHQFEKTRNALERAKLKVTVS